MMIISNHRDEIKLIICQCWRPTVCWACCIYYLWCLEQYWKVIFLRTFLLQMTKFGLEIMKLMNHHRAEPQSEWPKGHPQLLLLHSGDSAEKGFTAQTLEFLSWHLWKSFVLRHQSNSVWLCVCGKLETQQETLSPCVRWGSLRNATISMCKVGLTQEGTWCQPWASHLGELNKQVNKELIYEPEFIDIYFM